MAKKVSRDEARKTPKKPASDLETLSTRRQDETVVTTPMASGEQVVRFRSACTFRIVVSEQSRRLVFLDGFEPSPEISACLQEAFHRYFRGRRDGGRLVTREFMGDPKAAERYLNHVAGLAKDFFATAHPLPCQPFGKYSFEFEILTSGQLDELTAESVSPPAAKKSEEPVEWLRELENSDELRQGLRSLIGLHRLISRTDPPVETLREVHTLLLELRSAGGRLLSSIFNRWTGMQWDDFETSQTIASLMDTAATSLRLRFHIVDRSGRSRLAGLRCALTGRDRKPAFQYEFAGGGIQRVPRASRTLLAADLQPAPADPRRRRSS